MFGGAIVLVMKLNIGVIRTRFHEFHEYRSKEETVSIFRIMGLHYSQTIIRIRVCNSLFEWNDSWRFFT